jgi:hypothetical protein
MVIFRSFVVYIFAWFLLLYGCPVAVTCWLFSSNVFAHFVLLCVAFVALTLFVVTVVFPCSLYFGIGFCLILKKCAVLLAFAIVVVFLVFLVCCLVLTWWCCGGVVTVGGVPCVLVSLCALLFIVVVGGGGGTGGYTGSVGVMVRFFGFCIVCVVVLY